MVDVAAAGVHRLRQILTVVGAAVLLVGLSLVGLVPPAVPRAAAASNCQVLSENPHSMPSGGNTGFEFNIQDDVDAVAWVSVTVPSQNTVITNAFSDWFPNAGATSDTATYSGSTVNPGVTFTVDLQITSNFFPASNWIINASTDPNGANPFSCTGDTLLTITDNTPPAITSISASASTTTAIIDWQTDKAADSRIDYGTTVNYGQTATDTVLETGHEISLSSLRSATTYHYQITCTDQFGNSASSIDGTFRTAAIPISTTNQPAEPSSPLIPPVTHPSDKIPPIISLTTRLPKIVKSEPTLTGVASDNIAVVKVEYSTDGGKDWLPVDTTRGLNSKQVTFSFTPVNLDDDTYSLVTRATDGGGNTAVTTPEPFVLDTKPPIVGGIVVALGPQVLMPDDRGIISTLPGVNLSLAVSSTGGATSIDVQALNASNSGSLATTFSLQHSPDNGLWNGLLSFTKPGAYQLNAHAMDGAGNITDRIIENIVVVDPSVVLSIRGPVAKAHISVYFLDSDTNNWVLWDGRPYEQANPQQADNLGHFNLLLPAGTYYVHTEAPGYQSVNTISFTVSQPAPFSAALRLQQAVTFGPLTLPAPSFAVQTISFRTSGQVLPTALKAQPLIGTTLPSLMYANTAGRTETTVDWLGKPTLLSVMSDWAPMTSEQVPILEQLSANADLNIKTIGLQSNLGRLTAYDAVAGSPLVWLADPDIQTVNSLNTSNVPTHYLIDRKGVIRKILYGIHSYEELQNDLADL